MTTVTVITGTAKSGRPLIGNALMTYMMSPTNNTMMVTGEGKVMMFNNAPIKKRPPPANVQDLILVSGSEKIEKWMSSWIAVYGNPLFHIHSHRME
jgi:hypothetical protein